MLEYLPLLEYICSNVVLWLPFWKCSAKCYNSLLVAYSHCFFCPLCQLSNGHFKSIHFSIFNWHIYKLSVGFTELGHGLSHIASINKFNPDSLVGETPQTETALLQYKCLQTSCDFWKLWSLMLLFIRPKSKAPSESSCSYNVHYIPQYWTVT